MNWRAAEMNRYNLDEHRARIISCASQDQLADVVIDLCNCAGYPYRESMSIKDQADYAFLQGNKQLAHLLDIAAKRERVLR